MVELGYVNDANYASMVARHYAARGFGPGRVRDELRRRRVPREYWDDALGQLPDDGEAAYRCLCARLRGRAASPEELRRASAALSRRGFSWEEIRPALERYKSEFDSREEA